MPVCSSANEHLQGTADERAEYKKAVANMMVVWLIQTRSDLRTELRSGSDANEDWEATGILGVLNLSELQAIGATIGDAGLWDCVSSMHDDVAEAGWTPDKPCCPPNEIVKAMLDCAMSYIDSNWVVA